MSDDGVVIRRLIPASRQRIFAAWLDPAGLAEWMRPGNVSRVEVELDARVGGRFRIAMVHGGSDIEHWGEYLVIDPPSRLSFTWHSENTNRRPTIVTIELHERGSGTELVLTHRDLPEEKADAHRNGWGQIVAKLEAALSSVE